VDLAAVDAAILHRYLGREETAAFLTRHRRVDVTEMPVHALARPA
jgi:hypothetical protein